MLKKARLILSDSLVRSSGLMFAAFMTSSGFNYLFQVVMGRLMGPEQYGLLNALLSFIAVLGVPVATLLMVVSSKATEYKSIGNYGALSAMFYSVSWDVFKAGLLGLAVLACFSIPLAGYLNINSVIPVLLVGGVAFASLFAPVNTAFLQGIQDYKWLGISVGIGGPARLLFPSAFVLLGFGVNGALTGMVLTGIFTWAVSWFPIKKQIPAPQAVSSKLSFSRVMPVFVANLAFAVITQVDMVMAKSYFSHNVAGVYASAAILGRTVMYIPGSVVLAMFPMVSEATALKRSGGHLLVKALAVTALFSGGVAMLFYMFPEWTVRIVYGARYSEAAPILKYFGLAMLPMAFLMVFMNYFVAREKKVFAYIMAICAVLEVSLMNIHHSSPIDIVKLLGGVGMISLAGGVFAQWAPMLRIGAAKFGRGKAA